MNYTEILSLVCKTILIFNEHNFQSYFVLCKGRTIIFLRGGGGGIKTVKKLFAQSK